MILIIDHGQGNIGSLKNSLRQIGKKFRLCQSHEEIDWEGDIEGFILPGVGSFDQCMIEMKRRELDKLVYTFVDKGLKGMGICLGMQILCESSEEGGKQKGLGVIKGVVKKLSPENEKIPNMGWNTTYSESHIGDEICSLQLAGEYYYVHSYAVETLHKENRIAFFYHGKNKVTAGIYGKNILGVQFHPEKSQSKGLTLIKNYFN